MKLSKLLILGLLSSLTLIGCNVKKESSSASESSSIVSVSESSEVESSSEEPVIEYTASKVCEDFNASLAAKGYSFAAEWDESHKEYSLAVNFGSSDDESESNLGGAAYTLASFLPEYMVENFEIYGDPTSESYVDIFEDNSYYFYKSLISEDELSEAIIISYVYSGLLIAQIGISDITE